MKVVDVVIDLNKAIKEAAWCQGWDSGYCHGLSVAIQLIESLPTMSAIAEMKKNIAERKH